MLSGVVMCLNEAEKKKLAWLIMNITALREDHQGHVLILNVKKLCNIWSGDVPVPFISAACVCRSSWLSIRCLSEHQCVYIANDMERLWYFTGWNYEASLFEYVRLTIQHIVDINYTVSCCIKCTINELRASYYFSDYSKRGEIRLFTSGQAYQPLIRSAEMGLGME